MKEKKLCADEKRKENGNRKTNLNASSAKKETTT
jgi:hypothetical protein